LRVSGGCVPGGPDHRTEEARYPLSAREQLNVSYRADFICFDTVIVELKALSQISGVEVSQVLNYLKATGFCVGLLLNFGAPSLQQRRFVFSPSSQSAQSAESAD
jgi:GxxExxY protein